MADKEAIRQTIWFSFNVALLSNFKYEKYIYSELLRHGKAETTVPQSRFSL